MIKGEVVLSGPFNFMGRMQNKKNLRETLVVCTKEQAWVEILQILLPSFGTKAVSIGDSCLAAIHYGRPFEGMNDFSFAMRRVDYDRLLTKIEQTAIDASLIYDGTVEYKGASYPKPFVRIGKEFAGVEDQDTPNASTVRDVQPSVAWLYLYPLEPIPQQIILRFRLFKQASRMMRQWFSMEKTGVYSHIASFLEDQKRIGRFAALETGLYSNLYDRSCDNRKRERTVFQRTISEDHLFPVRMVDFAGGEIPVAHNVSNWTLEMTPTRKRAINIIQNKELECIQEIARVCESLKTQYFLLGGCLLGAVRHKGFIPWDDDADVGMVRKDYKKFCRDARKTLKQSFALQLPSTDKHSHFVYARLRDKSIKYITTYNEDKEFEKGIWCDIFPFDARPKSEVLARAQCFMAKNFARASMGFKRRKEYIQSDVRLDASSLTRNDRIYLRLYRIGATFFPVAFCRGGYHFFARIFNPFLGNRKNTQYASFVPTYTTISQEELFPCRSVPFEGISLDAPQQAEAFLKRQYGEFAVMPPIHKRFVEHGFKYLIMKDGEVIEP